MPPTPEPPANLRRVIGTLILAVGALWLFLAGSCTLLFAGGLLMNGEWDGLGGVLVIGVPAILIGYAIFRLGTSLRNRG